MNTPNLKTDILFSPFNDDEFLLISNNLFLYRIANYESGLDGSPIPPAAAGSNIGKVNSFISESSYLELLTSVSRYQSYKVIYEILYFFTFNNYLPLLELYFKFQNFKSKSLGIRTRTQTREIMPSHCTNTITIKYLLSSKNFILCSF